MGSDVDRLRKQAAVFRADVAELLEPGGVTATNLGRLSWWLAGPAWRLLAEQRRLLTAMADAAALTEAGR